MTTIAATAACDDPLQLPEASRENVVDTVTLYALHGTSVTLPSGYDLPTSSATRTDVSGFDFAFDITANGRAAVYPAGALGLPRSSGIFLTQQPFDSIKSAPSSGYVDSLSLAVDADVVFIVRSRAILTGCEFTGQLPRYGKFRVLAVDPVQRSMTMETLVNRNCGYRSLTPGTPTA
ncbi:MAG: hypothetical protein HY700_17560 [Gemmatimonadetes bacterium]|nr:hypothetical protein [Gemmatimonadota bacterium]